jgi:hypothetical protein
LPTIKRVVLEKPQKCNKCQKEIPAGNEAVKDRRNKKKTGKTEYYHTTCK